MKSIITTLFAVFSFSVSAAPISFYEVEDKSIVFNTINGHTIEGGYDAALHSYFSQLSKDMSTRTNARHITYWDTFYTYSHVESDTFYVNLSMSDLFGMSTLMTYDVKRGSRLVFNIAGSHIRMGGGDWLIKDSRYRFYHDPSNVLFNFYEADKVTVKGGIYGSILAPNAYVWNKSDHTKGQIIAHDFKGRHTYGYAAFNADDNRLITNTRNSVDRVTQVPEPKSMALVLFAILGLALFSRRGEKARL